MPQLDRSATVAEIVTQHAIAARVFQKHRIDFCCGGDVTVPEACIGRPVEPEELFAELEAAIPESASAEGGPEDPRAVPTPELIALIVERHHGYLRQAFPYLVPLAAKVARVHGEHNPKLQPLLETLVQLREALEPHLDDEEQVLFPALTAAIPDASVIRRELARMREEHLAVGGVLARMRSLADEFTTPGWGCNSYRVLMAELEALEGDVLRHVHLENHVLMPRFTRAAGQLS
jgi:regulator of cell morphogenesis and NO signaling